MLNSKRKLSSESCDEGVGSKKRRWIPTSSWDHIKGYVIDEVNKGIPQRSIVADLARQGTSIELHQLKRLLKEWGVRDRNICKKNRKYIFETEKRLREKGKAVKTWRFKDTNQHIKKTQLEMIRKSSGKEFEGVEASPGALVLSPAGSLEDSNSASPSEIKRLDNSNLRAEPSSEEEFQLDELSEYTLAESDNSLSASTFAPALVWQPTVYAFEDNQRLVNFFMDGEEEDQSSSVEEDQEEEDEEAEAEETDPSSQENTDSKNPIWPSDYNNFDAMPDNREIEEVEAVSETPITIEIRDGSQEDAEIPKILESLCANFTTSTNWVKPPFVQTKDTPLLYLFEHREIEEFCGYLAFQSRWSFEQRVTNITRKALEFVVEVKALEVMSNLPRSECEDLVRQEMISNSLEFYDNIPVDYSMARWIQNKPLPAFRRDVEDKIRPSFKDDIIREFYAVLGHLFGSVGSVHGSLQSVEGRRVFQSFHREQFHGQLVQLPYLLQKYGLTHWSAFSTLQLFNEFCILWYGKSFWQGKPVLRENMDFLITVLSSFKPSKHLITCWMDLITGLHELGDLPEALKVAQNILEKARRSLGDREIFTIWVAAKIQLILWEMNQKEEANKIGAYIGYCLKKQPSNIQRLNDFVEINLLLGSDILNFQLKQKSYAEGAKYARLLDAQLGLGTPGYDDSLDSLAGHCNRGVFDCIKARSLSEAGDYKGALLGLQKSIRELKLRKAYYQSASTWVTRELMELTTEIMVKRGVVRYSQPILKRIARGLDDHGIPDDHPVYRRVLVAELSADFQLSLEEDDWSIPRMMCPEVSFTMQLN